MIGVKTSPITTATDHGERLPSAAIAVTAMMISGSASTASIRRLTTSSTIPRM